MSVWQRLFMAAGEVGQPTRPAPPHLKQRPPESADEAG